MKRAISCVLTFLVLLAACSFALAGKKQKNNDQEVLKQAKAVEENSGGNAAAEFFLGDSYENGRGVPQDYAEALSWYLKSANRDYAAAQASLAWLYFSHPPSKCTADELQSTDKTIPGGQGTPEIAERISACYEYEDNYEEAYFWVDVALASGEPVKNGGLTKEGRSRAIILKKMLEGGMLHTRQGDRSSPALLSSEKIAAAQAKATKWFAAHEKPAQ